MKKNTLLYILLAFLLIVNGFFLVNYLGKSKKHKNSRDDRRNYIVKKLDFNDSQTAQYELLKNSHREKIKTISVSIRELKDVLFDNITNPSFSERNLDSITTLIANKEKQKDIEVFNHFKAIEKICDEDQKEKLIHIIKDALHRQGGRRNQGPPDRRPPPHQQ